MEGRRVFQVTSQSALTWIWAQDVAPYMQLDNAAYGFGALSSHCRGALLVVVLLPSFLLPICATYTHTHTQTQLTPSATHSNTQTLTHATHGIEPPETTTSTRAESDSAGRWNQREMTWRRTTRGLTVSSVPAEPKR